MTRSVSTLPRNPQSAIRNGSKEFVVLYQERLLFVISFLCSFLLSGLFSLEWL